MLKLSGSALSNARVPDPTGPIAPASWPRIWLRQRDTRFFKSLSCKIRTSCWPEDANACSLAAQRSAATSWKRSKSTNPVRAHSQRSLTVRLRCITGAWGTACIRCTRHSARPTSNTEVGMRYGGQPRNQAETDGDIEEQHATAGPGHLRRSQGIQRNPGTLQRTRVQCSLRSSTAQLIQVSALRTKNQGHINSALSLSDIGSART